MSKIQVYLKLKPGEESGFQVINHEENSNSINVNISKDHPPAKFSFTQLFDESSGTVEIFNNVLKLPISELIKKQSSATFFTVGPSNSGKTYSLFGKRHKNHGLVYYSLKELFSQIEKHNGPSYNETIFHEILGSHYGGLMLNASDIVDDPKKTAIDVPSSIEEQSSKSAESLTSPDDTSEKLVVSISMFEIYKDSIIDLLELTKDYAFLKKQIKKQVHKSTEIFNDIRDGKVKPSNIFTVSVSSLEQAMLLITSGLKKRHVSATSINSQSSRSHLFIHVNVHNINTNARNPTIKSSFNGKNNLTHEAFPGKSIKIKTTRLTIADLAGSEKAKTAQTTNNKSTFNEGNRNNQSLTELGRILSILSKSKNKTKEKYLLRSDKLTRLLLSDYIGHIQNRMMILVNLNPYGDFSTISSTLKLISPLDQFKNAIVESNSTKISPFNFRLNFKTKEPKLLPLTPRQSIGSRTNKQCTPSANVTPVRISESGKPASHERASSVNSTGSQLSSIAAIAENESTIAFRRLSMAPSESPLGSSRSSTAHRKRNSSSPLVESFTANSSRTIVARIHTRHVVKSGVPSRASSFPINRSDTDTTNLERLVYQNQGLSDENSFLKERIRLLEEQLKNMDETHKESVKQMATDLSSSRIELDDLGLANAKLESSLRDKQKEIENLEEKIKQMEFFKEDLATATASLEQVKHRLTVVVFENHELHKKYSDCKEKYAKLQEGVRSNSSSSKSNSNSTIEAEKTPVLGKIDSFYFDGDLLNSALNTKPEDLEDYKIQPLHSSLTSEATGYGNLTSNSSAIFDSEDSNCVSVANSQYESELDHK